MVKICHFVRPTQTSILVASSRMSLALLYFPQFFNLNSEIPISAESYIFLPKNVRIFMSSTILEENLQTCFYNADLQCHRKEKKPLKECRKRETEGLKRTKEAVQIREVKRRPRRRGRCLRRGLQLESRLALPKGGSLGGSVWVRSAQLSKGD